MVLRKITCSSLNHSVRTKEHRFRNRQSDLFRRFEIDDELELSRLLHREISWFGAFQNLVNVGGSASVQVGEARAVAHKAPSLYIFWKGEYRWEPILCREICNLFSLRIEDGGCQHKECIGTLRTCG